jgi:hypothetical protein
MIIELSVTFVVGLVFGRGLHHLAHDRCPFVHSVPKHYSGTGTQRCSLREGHGGPHRITWHASSDLVLPTVDWIKNEEDS